MKPFTDRLQELALAGDLGAIREVFDRVEGKAVQPVDGPDEGALEESLEAVLERISEKRKLALRGAEEPEALERLIDGEVVR